MKKRVRLNRKLAALAAGILLAGGGTASAFYFNEPVQDNKTTAKRAVIEPTSEKTATAQEPVDTTPITNETTAAPVDATTESAPSYGEDPNNPGVFIVFDKTEVMTQAGIPDEQQSAANSLISKRMNWIYKRTAMPEANICYIAPITKMASAGADYKTNPITQLTYCNNYVQGRYKGWSSANAYFETHGTF